MRVIIRSLRTNSQTSGDSGQEVTSMMRNEESKIYEDAFSDVNQLTPRLSEVTPEDISNMKIEVRSLRTDISM